MAVAYGCSLQASLSAGLLLYLCMHVFVYVDFTCSPGEFLDISTVRKCLWCLSVSPCVCLFVHVFVFLCVFVSVCRLRV